MRISHHTQDSVTLEAARRAPASAFSALLFGCAALLPLLAPGPWTLPRLATALTLLGVATALTRRWWGPPDRVELDLSTGHLRAGRQRYPLERARAWVLRGAEALDHEGPERYRVHLLFAGGQEVLVLADSNAGAVLCDLRALHERLALPVRAGWGLPEEPERWLRPAGVPAPTGERFVAERSPHQRATGGLLLLGGALTSLLMGRLYLLHVLRGEPHLPLSAVLPLGFCGALLLLGLSVLTDRSELLDADRLVLTRRTLGVAWRTSTIHRARVHALWTVGTVPHVARHLLLDLGDHVLCVPFARRLLLDATRQRP